MSIQLNNMKTARVRNRKAVRTTRAVRKYSVQMACLGEVGVNWDVSKTHRGYYIITSRTTTRSKKYDCS